MQCGWNLELPKFVSRSRCTLAVTGIYLNDNRKNAFSLNRSSAAIFLNHRIAPFSMGIKPNLGSHGYRARSSTLRPLACSPGRRARETIPAYFGIVQDKIGRWQCISWGDILLK
jgi:hypothetical protein